MIDLHYWPTGNGLKALIALEELALPYRAKPLNIRTNEHHTDAFAALNPHRRTPVMVDDAPAGGGEPRVVYESAAILLYLADKARALLPADDTGRWQATQWLFWHSAHLVPGLGLLQRYHETDAAGSSDAQRAAAVAEAQRLYRTLDDRLATHDFLAGPYSVADIAVFPWVQPRRHHVEFAAYPHLARWHRSIAARPAVQRAYAAGRALAPSEKALLFTAQPDDLAQQRGTAVERTLATIRGLLGTTPPDRAALAQVASVLDELARQPQLFPASDFAPPDVSSGVGASTRYRLNPHDGDAEIALYLNSINPGKTTIPHNHDTWAVIVAIEGEELNRVYRRADDGRDAGFAKLEIEREFTVRPGHSIQFLPDDLHSIHVAGERPTLHFHLYGKPLETLAGRIGIEPATGAIVKYNATQFKPSQAAA